MSNGTRAAPLTFSIAHLPFDILLSEFADADEQRYRLRTLPTPRRVEEYAHHRGALLDGDRRRHDAGDEAGPARCGVDPRVGRRDSRAPVVRVAPVRHLADWRRDPRRHQSEADR